MADSYTAIGSVAWNVAAWDKYIRFALQPELHAVALATVKPTSVTTPGATVNFPFVNDLTINTTPLSETVDVDAEAISDASVNLTTAEYGKATVTTARLRAHSYLDVNQIQARVMGTNMGRTMDKLAMNALQVGTNVLYPAALTARNTLTTSSNMSGALVRKAYNKLDRANVGKFNGAMYVALAHPDTIYDLRSATGAGEWRQPKEYVDPGEIYSGELGEFEGFRWIKTTNAPLFVNASNGSGSTGNIDAYRTVFLGAEALAETYATQDGYGANPTFVVSPVTDKLRRFVPLGWKWMGTFGIFRQQAIWAVETASSVGDNAS